MFLQALDKIAGQHRLAYVGAEPHDNAGANTSGPSRGEGDAHALQSRVAMLTSPLRD